MKMLDLAFDGKEGDPFDPLPPLVTSSTKSYFDRNGFVSLERVTSGKEVVRIRGILEDLFASRRGYAEGALFDFIGLDGEGESLSIPQLFDPRSFAPELVKTEFFRNASNIARVLLGPEARFAADHALVKSAVMGAATPWHQDEAFHSSRQFRNEISIWMPLQPVDQLNGSLSFIPGSHLGDVLPHRSLNGNAKIHALECFTGFDARQAINCKLPAGGCTIHTSRTLHAAGPNKSDHPRFAYVLVFHGPAVSTGAREERPWLIGKSTPRMKRRRQWMRRTGLFVHGWRRIIQIKQIGLRETLYRISLKISSLI
jgi:ectoine hydroxylase-related dioxygenase (phytanoyl-CoA dioxygenase family)